MWCDPTGYTGGRSYYKDTGTYGYELCEYLWGEGGRTIAYGAAGIAHS